MMIDAHPLDRPAWSALSTRQRTLALGDARALRLDPEYGPFAAAAGDDPEPQAALAALVAPGQGVALVETEAKPAPEGLRVVSTAAVWQMALERLTSGPAPPGFEDLGEADAPDMFAFARATRPGPFEARTHQLGAFIGVRRGGALAAMAGERLRPEGWTEVSGVCTDPAWRGHGLAASLTRVVADRILARGEGVFLHVYATNAAAISVYQTLGFRRRRELVLTVLARP
jgi:predicted GNAT family acetyltransferase